MREKAEKQEEAGLGSVVPRCASQGLYAQCPVPSQAIWLGLTHSAGLSWLDGVEISTPLPNLCMALGKFLILSGPELTHLQNGNHVLYLTGSQRNYS